MINNCPNCKSDRVDTKDVAKKTCGFLGVVGGVASGTTGTFGGAEVGGTIGMIAGPAGVALGSFSGAFMGALLAGAAGGVAGAKPGEVIDDRILDNYQCLDCHYVFSEKTK